MPDPVALDIKGEVAVKVCESGFPIEVLIETSKVVSQPAQLVTPQISFKVTLKGMSTDGDGATNPVPVRIVDRSRMRSPQDADGHVIGC